MNNTHLSTNDHHAIDQLFEKATSYVEEARNRVQRSINSEMVQAFGILEEISLQRNKKDKLGRHMEANYFKNCLID